MGVKLVVSIQTVAPGSGRKVGAMRAVKTVTSESGGARATRRKAAIVSSGSGTHASHAPVASTGTGRPSMVRVSVTSPRRRVTFPKRKDESCAWMGTAVSG